MEKLDTSKEKSLIKVIGVGTAGYEMLRYMNEIGVDGVEFIYMDVDEYYLYQSFFSNQVKLGPPIEGLGERIPECGKMYALESIDDIKSSIGAEAKKVFIITGMGAGTGTGATPVIAKIAKEMGIFTVAIVTKPFSFEGKRRNKIAEEGIENLRENVDSLIVVNNDKVRELFGELSFEEFFTKSNEVLTSVVRDIVESTVRFGIPLYSTSTLVKISNFDKGFPQKVSNPT